MWDPPDAISPRAESRVDDASLWNRYDVMASRAASAMETRLLNGGLGLVSPTCRS